MCSNRATATRIFHALAVVTVSHHMLSVIEVGSYCMTGVGRIFRALAVAAVSHHMLSVPAVASIVRLTTSIGWFRAYASSFRALQVVIC